MGDTTVALRIAVDGPSGAGKTTTARALGEQLGRVVLTPQEADDGRTELFDWLDYAGGRHRGHPIRTHVIAVPGHRAAHRRVILELADVVLFVADSTASGLDGSAVAFRDLQALRRSMDRAPGLVVQANKRDAADAEPVDDLRVLLEVPDDVNVVETVAASGDGIRQAFVFAVRCGLTLLDELDGSDRADLTPDELTAQLRDLDDRVDDRTTSGATAGGPSDGGPVGEDVPVVELEIPFEDMRNQESIDGLVAATAAVTGVVPTTPEPAPVTAEPTTAVATTDPFAHLPPPPGLQAAGPPPAGAKDTSARRSRWRRRHDEGGASR